LNREIVSITKANQETLRITFPSANAVIDQLKRMGWIHPIKTQPPNAAESVEFLLLDMEAGKGEPINPLELLQSYLPDGVVSFFSAITYYGLTTQVAAHHHVARLNAPKAKIIQEVGEFAEAEPGAKAIERNPLGTEIFRFEDVGYYANRRDASLVPGIQFRVVSPRCWLRITTLEQTLLDALMQPVRCGGEAVAMEAWESGVREIDAERMADHVAKIQREDLERRVGCMLEMVGAGFADTPLAVRFKAIKDRLMTQEVPEISLLNGFQFPELNKTWKVRTP
jgi:predicted transcriptional regulator of viral defense system